MVGILFEITAQLQEEVALDLVPMVKQRAISAEKTAQWIPLPGNGLKDPDSVGADVT